MLDTDLKPCPLLCSCMERLSIHRLQQDTVSQVHGSATLIRLLHYVHFLRSSNQYWCAACFLSHTSPCDDPACLLSQLSVLKGPFMSSPVTWSKPSFHATSCLRQLPADFSFIALLCRSFLLIKLNQALIYTKRLQVLVQQPFPRSVFLLYVLSKCIFHEAE